MISKKSKGLLCTAITTLILTSSIFITNAQAASFMRLGGVDRYQTSTNIASKFISESNYDSIVIATGEDYHDAISSVVFAKQIGAPLILSNGNYLNNTTKDFLRSKTDKKIYIIGSKLRMTNGVESDISYSGFYDKMERISGNTDYDTNAAVVDKMNVAIGTPVVIVSGAGYADGISVSSIAAVKGYPILMVDVNSIANSTANQLRKIKPSKIYFVGGTGVISQANRNNIASIAGVSSDNVINLSGSDRYQTNLNIMNEFKIPSDTVAFAYGGEDNTDGKFADALAGTGYASAKNAPILLVDSNNNNTDQKKFADSMNYTNRIFYGGIGSISDNLANFLSGGQQVTEDIGKLFNVAVTPDPGSTTNYVSQAWGTVNIYGDDMTNPDYNKAKADMVSYYPASQMRDKDYTPTEKFVFNADGKLKIVYRPIAGDASLLPITYGLNYDDEQTKFIERQYYCIMNRFLSQDNSTEKMCFETNGWINATKDISASRGISFATDGKCDFMFGVPFKKAWEHLPSDFKTGFDGCIEFISINNMLSQDRLDSLKMCLNAAFGDARGDKIYAVIINSLKNDHNYENKYKTYNVDGITVVCDSLSGTFGFK